MLYKVFIRRTIDESLAVLPCEVIAQMEAPPENERCVTTLLEAVRNALIDAQVTTLAVAIVEARSLETSN